MRACVWAEDDAREMEIGEVPPELLAELTEAAETAHRLDVKMERLNDEFAKIKAQPGMTDDLPEVALPPQLLDALRVRLPE